MFTGLVETLAPVVAVRSIAAAARLVVESAALAAQLSVGESVAVNGCCLTVVQIEGDRFHFEAGPETLCRTNLGQLRAGDRGARLGGHLVSGHVDGTGTITAKRTEGDWVFMAFSCEERLTAQMVPKGSICVDGISLTVVKVEHAGFDVMLIPHTLAVTTLGFKEVGAVVNLETDMLAKYVFKALEHFQGHLQSRQST
ncbi:MAG: riboflavin synthase [Gemmataceae bacterium]